MSSRLALAALSVLALNVPFGFWRAGEPKFTRSWIVAVHAPVPLVIAVRFIAGLGFHLVTFPVLVGAFFTGQFVGGTLRRWSRRSLPLSPDPPQATANAVLSPEP